MVSDAGFGSNPRAGVSLVETMVALVVGLMVLQLGLATLARFRSVQGQMADRADALVALRLGRHVLREELRYGVPGRDWSVFDDSLPLRAFRGTSSVCANDSTAARLTVSYRGSRAPDPAKDSVLLLMADGTTSVRALVATGASSISCAGPGAGVRQLWTLDHGAPVSTVATRIFERGSYHIASSALRYRRGASGRQPLTPEVWTSASAWNASTERLEVSLVPTGGSTAWRGFVAWLRPH
jgi:hypothetical protein